VRRASRASLDGILLAVCLLVACSAPAKPRVDEPPPAVGNLAPPVDTYCAWMPGLGPWHAEVFPACPPNPIGTALHVCDPGECPTPCAMSSDIADNMGMATFSSSWLYRYDDRGRWIETVSEDDNGTHDPADTTTCAYDGDRIASCTVRQKPARAERDARGRITRVTIGDDAVTVTYGAHGEVTAVGESTLRYDERGRVSALTLAGERVHVRLRGEITLERDASGRVLRQVGREITTFVYEADGRVREAVSKRTPWKLSSEEPPKPPGPDALTAAGRSWRDGDICLDCPDGPVDVVKDPETERKEMLEWIEASATIQRVQYEGARILSIASGRQGPQMQVRDYVYDCAKAR